MQSDYGYELTDRAEKDIDEIAGYIRDELGNAGAAMNFLNDVDQYIRRMCDFPSSGSRIFAEYLPGKNIRRKVIGNYLLYYRVLQEKKMIRVLRVVYGARNQDEIVRKLSN